MDFIHYPNQHYELPEKPAVIVSGYRVKNQISPIPEFSRRVAC
jgi:hypothetical protein